MGPATGRPTPWSADSVVALLYKNRCIGSPWHSLYPVYQFHSELLLPLLSLLLFLSKFIRKRKKRFPSFAFPFASHLHFVFTFFSSQERVCGGTTTPQEWFCGASSPTRMILWSVITHKNNFVRGNHAPQGLLTLGQLTWFSLTLT